MSEIATVVPDMEDPLNTVKFTFTSLPPSVNSLYQIIYAQRRVELKPAARMWKSDMKKHVKHFNIAPDSWLKIDLLFAYPYYHKSGSMRTFDSPNLIKLTIDCICEKLGINDARVKCGSWDSVDNDADVVEVTLTEVLANVIQEEAVHD